MKRKNNFPHVGINYKQMGKTKCNFVAERRLKSHELSLRLLLLINNTGIHKLSNLSLFSQDFSHFSPESPFPWKSLGPGKKGQLVSVITYQLWMSCGCELVSQSD